MEKTLLANPGTTASCPARRLKLFFSKMATSWFVPLGLVGATP